MSSVSLKVLTVILFVLVVIAPAARADRTEEAIEKAAYMNASVVRMYKEGRIEEALNAGERAYKTIAETLGPEHPETATALYNLAVLLQETGELRRAEALFIRALKIREATLGARHRDTIESRRRLADIRKILAGPKAAGEPKPSEKIKNNSTGSRAPVKIRRRSVRVAPVQPKVAAKIEVIKPEPRAKILPQPIAVPKPIGAVAGKAPAIANGGGEPKSSVKILKNGSGGNAAVSGALRETGTGSKTEGAPLPLKTRSLEMVLAESGEESQKAGAMAVKFDEYKVQLGVDALMKIPGVPGELRVWIGAPEYAPEFREGMKKAAGSLPKVGETAKVTVFAPAFEVEPRESICMRLHPTGAEVRFMLRPTRKGVFNVSADVNLYGSDDCSGAPVPKAVETLQVTVKVDAGEVVGERAGEMWEVFWGKFLDFWGAVVALFFGLILFLLRGKLKKIFGFGGGKKG